MNDGKICVSVCAATADEFNSKAREAAGLADLTELRFDCLAENEFERVEVAFDERIILTFRPKEQGGAREISLEDRHDFWNSAAEFSGADLEEDMIENAMFRGFSPKICSFHDLSGSPSNLSEIFERLASTGTDVVKIAILADDITDGIGVWKLLELAQVQNRRVIPIAMGEAGKWTRILGLAHGAFLTYASMEPGSETAPGQLTVDALREIYRVKELDRETEVYGLIGGNTSHSMSPYIHNPAFQSAGKNAVFIPLQVGNVGEFMRRMVKTGTREIDLNFRGFAVTIPHKQSVIPYLDSIDETAQAIGAVNTIKIENGKLRGYNTDAAGFIEPLIRVRGDLRGAKVAVIGAGGAARACVHALKKQGSDVMVFARDNAKATELAAEFEVESSEYPDENHRYSPIYGAFDILVNATPVGMRGRAENETPATAEQLAGLDLVYDLVYTPLRTKLMEEAEKALAGTLNGLEMLVEQAAEQQLIWTGARPETSSIHASALARLDQR